MFPPVNSLCVWDFHSNESNKDNQAYISPDSIDAKKPYSLLY